MVERADNQEIEPISEQEGLPLDLYTNPAKYDADIPLWKRTVSFVKQYQNTRPKKREAFLDQTASPLVKGLQAMKHVIENLDLVAQAQTGVDIQPIQSALVSRVEVAAAKRSNLPTWTPQRIEELAKLGLNPQGVLKEVAERITVAVFSAPQTVEESVDLHYNAAWAMVTTNNTAVQEELFSLLCFEKDTFKSDSLSAVLFSFGVHASDDAYLAKYHAVMDALDYTGILAETKTTGEMLGDSRRTWNRAIKLHEAAISPFFKHQARLAAIAAEQFRKNPQRARKLSDAIEQDENQTPLSSDTQGKNYIESLEMTKRYLQTYDAPVWPYNVMRNPDEPLRKLVFGLIGPQIYMAGWEQFKIRKGYHPITERSLPFAKGYRLEIATNNAVSTEQRNDIVRQVYETLAQGKAQNPLRKLMVPMDRIMEFLTLGEKRSFGFWQEFDSDKNIVFSLAKNLSEETTGRLSSRLQYHRPPLSLDQVKAIGSQLITICSDIKSGFVRSASRRGYTIIVADPILKRLGYESITARRGAGPKSIEVKMVIDKETYSFGLFDDYRIIPGDDVKQFTSPQDQAWLEILTLSHLKKLLCTEEEEEKLKAELVGGEKQYERYRRQIGGKTEHLRKQTPGWNYRTRAFELCLKSHLPVKNLETINKMRSQIGWGGTKETGIWTYVSGTEYVDIPDARPVKVAFKNVTEDMRQVISLGQISPEEITRLEKEILEELEIQ